MAHPLVVHNKRDAFDVYVGRPSIWGNPFTHLEASSAERRVANRAEAVARFESWLNGRSDMDLAREKRAKILESLPSLKGKRLGCWCAPQECHGDVLARMANR